jgi:hypothetical protein
VRYSIADASDRNSKGAIFGISGATWASNSMLAKVIVSEVNHNAPLLKRFAAKRLSWRVLMLR